MMADGEVVAEGYGCRDRRRRSGLVVEADDWSAAFGASSSPGWQVALAGRVLRVPGASPAEVCGGARCDGPAESGWRVYTAPATLEERFFELALHTTRDEVGVVRA